MRNVFLIGFFDLKVLLKDRTTFIWLLLMPLVFVGFFGLVIQGDDGEPRNPNPKVLVDNLDTGFMGTLLLEALDARGMRLAGEEDRDEVERGITIPADFTEKVLATEQVKIEFFKTEGSGGAPAAMIEVRLVRALVALNAALIEFVMEHSGDTEPTEPELRALLEAEDPVKIDARFAGKDPIPAGFYQSLPGNLIMFLMINLLSFGAISLSIERKEGIVKRLAVYPIRRFELVLGKILGRFLVGAVQIVIILAAGHFLFGVSIGHNLPLILLTMFIFGWMVSAFGVLIGAVSANPDRNLGIAIIVGMMMAALGGCWWPLEVVGDTMQAIGMSLPTGWAMSAMHQLISFGGGFAQIDWQLGALAGLGLVVTLLAGRLLKYE